MRSHTLFRVRFSILLATPNFYKVVWSNKPLCSFRNLLSEYNILSCSPHRRHTHTHCALCRRANVLVCGSVRVCLHFAKLFHDTNGKITNHLPHSTTRSNCSTYARLVVALVYVCVCVFVYKCNEESEWNPCTAHAHCTRIENDRGMKWTWFRCWLFSWY